MDVLYDNRSNRKSQARPESVGDWKQECVYSGALISPVYTHTKSAAIAQVGYRCDCSGTGVDANGRRAVDLSLITSTINDSNFDVAFRVNKAKVSVKKTKQMPYVCLKTILIHSNPTVTLP